MNTHDTGTGTEDDGPGMFASPAFRYAGALCLAVWSVICIVLMTA